MVLDQVGASACDTSLSQISDAGVQGLTDSGIDQLQASCDVRRLRKQIESACVIANSAAALLDGLLEGISDRALLRKLLLPIATPAGHMVRVFLCRSMIRAVYDLRGLLSYESTSRVVAQASQPVSRNAFDGGDSLVRVLLGISKLQPGLACALLDLLPLQQQRLAGGMAGGTASPSVSDLIVAQLRW